MSGRKRLRLTSPDFRHVPTSTGGASVRRSRLCRLAACTATIAATATLVLPTAAGAASNSTVKGISAADAQAATDTYADLVYASYDDSVQSAVAMRTAISAFLANPNDATLTAAKQAWLSARD